MFLEELENLDENMESKNMENKNLKKEKDDLLGFDAFKMLHTITPEDLCDDERED